MTAAGDERTRFEQTDPEDVGSSGRAYALNDEDQRTRRGLHHGGARRVFGMNVPYSVKDEEPLERTHHGVTHQ
jgi:hypothetical protein